MLESIEYYETELVKNTNHYAHLRQFCLLPNTQKSFVVIIANAKKVYDTICS